MHIRSEHGTHQLRRDGRVVFESDDFAIVYTPSESYYNRGRCTIESEIEIVFKKFVASERNKELIHVTFERSRRLTNKAIEEAKERAKDLLATNISAKEFAKKFGPGVRLTRRTEPNQFQLISPEGSTIFGAEVAFGSPYLKEVREDGRTYYETTTPEHEAQKRAEEEDRQIQQNRKTCEELLDSLLLNTSREEQLRIVAMFKRLKIS